MRNPVVFGVEVLFLVTVTVHALLALVVGTATIAYGLSVLLVVAARG